MIFREFAGIFPVVKRDLIDVFAVYACLASKKFGYSRSRISIEVDWCFPHHYQERPVSLDSFASLERRFSGDFHAFC